MKPSEGIRGPRNPENNLVYRKRSIWTFWMGHRCASSARNGGQCTRATSESAKHRQIRHQRLIGHGLLLSIVLLVLGVPRWAAAEDLPSVDDVTEKLDELYRSDSSHSEMTMEINTSHWSRTLEMESWTKGEDLGVVVIRSPAKEAGTATLRNEEGLWNYAPRADRLMRIPSGMLSDGWMGSHFTNDDLMRESSWLDDYDSTISRGELNGDEVLKIVSVPKPDSSVVYSRVINYLTADDWLPLRAEYYDDEDLVRTMTFSSVKTLDGRTLPTVMKLVPEDKPDESTTVTYDSAEFDLKIKDSLFTARGLRKIAQR